MDASRVGSASLLVLVLLSQIACGPAEEGVVVESVGAGAGAAAGIRAGDRFDAWERLDPPDPRSAASGRIATMFDWSELVEDVAPLGPVRLRGRRGEQALALTVEPGVWRVRVQPAVTPPAGSSWAETKTQGDIDPERWASLVTRVEEPWLRCWLQLRLGQALSRTQEWERAFLVFAAAADEARRAGLRAAELALLRESAGCRLDHEQFAEAEQLSLQAFSRSCQGGPARLACANTLAEAGLAAWRQGNQDAAEAHYGRSLELARALAPEGRAAATALAGLALAAWRRGDLAAAERLNAQALAIRERLLPDTEELATSFSIAGILASDRDDLDAAERFHLRALALREKLAPSSMNVAASLGNLGSVAHDRGDLAAAEEYARRDLAITERIAPTSIDAAWGHNNLGTIAQDRGDLAGAEAGYNRALAIWEEVTPNTLEVAMALGNLGGVAHDRGDYPAALGYMTRVIALKESLAPDSLDLAGSLNDLATVQMDAGDLEAAAATLARALGLVTKHAPGSLDESAVLESLGTVSLRLGDASRSRTLLNQALAIRSRLAPGSMLESDALFRLGSVELRAGDFAAALDLHGRALAIRERLAPASWLTCESLHQVARIQRQRGDIGQALQLYERAVEALEAQMGRVGGPDESRATFRSKFDALFEEYFELLVEQLRLDEAFHLLERSRARALLTMLAERDVVLSADGGAALDSQRRRLAWQHDEVLREIAELNPQSDADRLAAAQARLRELRDQRSALAEALRRASPRLAALEYPVPLDRAGATRVLENGTLLLVFSVRAHGSSLFTLTPDGRLTLHRLEITQQQLGEEVERFRTLVERGRYGGPPPRALVEQGRRLWTMLLAPAADRVAAAERILIVPDGPLNELPFAALVLPASLSRGLNRPGEVHYLVEWRPLHRVVSLTVYAELGRGTAPAAEAEEGPRVVAFGDPLATDQALEATGSARGGLVSLPSSRTEVDAIGEVFGESALVLVGADANEERVRSLPSSVRILHFACHGILDEKFPLNSGLALSPPAQVRDGTDNGLLQAWEVFERVRLKADLVTLSACQTGLGKQTAGEGLLGLTRAFQLAGARSVLASLWRVSDDSTATLMRRFYQLLAAGRPKAEALRAAQLDLITGAATGGRGAELAHPFHWAAFELVGDWH